MHRLHHKGIIAEAAGAQLWIAGIAVIFLRDLGYHIPIYWASDGWVIGLLLIAWGAAVQARTEEITREPATKDRFGWAKW